PHGLRAYQSLDENQGYPETRMPATMFPCASAMSSTFSPSLLQEVGQVIADECNHYGIDIILGPGVNGKRSPLGGRNFEYYSEDPFLTAECATAFVKGVQSRGVGTSLKHFILNEQEHSRRYADSRVDARTFRELYAYPFEQVVKRAHPTTIMSSYNRVGGHYASENPFLLETLLREQWGYDGIVISDWGAVQDKAKSVSASLDIEMPESEWKDASLRMLSLESTMKRKSTKRFSVFYPSMNDCLRTRIMEKQRTSQETISLRKKWRNVRWFC
ncbi:MAG: glycoside hydrolase family 3 N-terminal domain-containing protein, partial [Candidatus Izemoplasmatales bacterium]|nr:glycoside hydrolase family 3 N-terminal domain-containing protein [Candidatus Izemoplasmatales bacterium]